MSQGTSLPLQTAVQIGDTATVRGVVSSVVYCSGDQSFSVIKLLLTNGNELSVVGPLGDLAQGEPLRITGRYEESKNHGTQLRAQTVVPELPNTEGGIERMLGLGFVKGIGPKIAKRIVQKFGTSTLDVIHDHPERLKEIEDIGKARAEKIVEAFQSRKAELESKSFLFGLGLGPSLARRIWERFGVETARVVRDNPFRLAEEVTGVGFLTADKVGRSLNIAPNDPRRIAGATLYLLMEAIDEGHTALPPDQLALRADTYEIAPEAVHEAIGHLAARKTVVVDHGFVYAPPLYEAEVRVAQEVSRVLKTAVSRVAEKTLTMPSVSQALVTLNTRQREAVLHTMVEPMLVLTGGPGTGKTTAVKALVALHRAAGHKILLAAPTGRAARRLSEATQHPAGTIHRLLEWVPRLQRFARNETSPLDADLVLVDEASMLDVQLGASLLRALRPGARIVFVGDADQLPPVGPGTVLADLLTIADIRAVRLTEVFRQAAASAIVRGAYEILQGKLPTPSPSRPPLPDGVKPVAPSGELFFVKCDDGEHAAKLLVDTVSKKIPRSFGVHPVRDIQVLVPTHRGPLGAQVLNEALQTALNPNTTRGRKGFSVGDKVMQLKNDYDLDVWNGDIGTVTHIDTDTITVVIEGREVVYKSIASDHLTLAYAATVHKSQGSEYDVVVVALHTSHFVLLNRALVYTAITRARRLVVVVGSEKAMRIAVDTARVVERYGALRTRLREVLSTT
jgi:exodeoxyribonuclease V alpha subunit